MSIFRTILACFLLALPASPNLCRAADRGLPLRLPSPRLSSDVSLEQALVKRRSVRTYRNTALTLAQASQLLWAGQGVTDARGFRTAPSAGALYPLQVYLVAGSVEGLAAGVYRYLPESHALLRTATGDLRQDLGAACLGQGPVQQAAAALVITAIYERTTRKYGDRGIRYAHIEAGHAAQNISLQATALGLGTVVIGAFHDTEVRQVLGLSSAEKPLVVLPVGAP